MADSENPPLDSEDWKVVFRAYEEYPILAFILAQHLDTVKVLIQHSPEGREAAIAGLDRAIDCLFPLTIFHQVGHILYLRAVVGKLVPELEIMIDQITDQPS
jgi:hypothetical protein